MRRFALLLVMTQALVWGCGSSTPAPTTPAEPAAPAEPPAPEATTPAVATCDDACTEYAVCSEEVTGEDFHHGGACASACEELAADEQAAYFACIDGAESCAAMMDC